MKMAALLLALGISALSLTACIGHRPEPGANNYLDDKVTAARVRQVLEAQHGAPFSAVQVVVNRGTAVLAGTVRTPAERAQAEELVKGVQGIRATQNELRVLR